MSKPTISGSLSKIGKAIKTEVVRHGGAQGIAEEVLASAKSAGTKVGETSSKYAKEATEKVKEYAKDTAEHHCDCENCDCECHKEQKSQSSLADLTERVRKQAALEAEAIKLRARLSEINNEKHNLKGGE